MINFRKDYSSPLVCQLNPTAGQRRPSRACAECAGRHLHPGGDAWDAASSPAGTGGGRPDPVEGGRIRWDGVGGERHGSGGLHGADGCQVLGSFVFLFGLVEVGN